MRGEQDPFVLPQPPRFYVPSSPVALAMRHLAPTQPSARGKAPPFPQRGAAPPPPPPPGCRALGFPHPAPTPVAVGRPIPSPAAAGGTMGVSGWILVPGIVCVGG